MKIVVIIPTYNERENIITLLDELGKQATHIRNHVTHFLVVDDNSPDGTSEVVADYQKIHKNVTMLTGAKEGLGKALLRGMRYATDFLGGQIIVQIDADLSHDPRVFPEFINKIDKGADFAVGSRYIPGGSIPDNWGVHRKIYSILGNAFVRFGLGFTQVHDWTGGYRAYKAKFVELLGPHMSQYGGYVFQIAFLHKAILSKALVVEVPIHFTDRRFGRSKIAPSEYIRNVVSYVVHARALSIVRGSFGKFLVVGSIGFIINTLILELFVMFGIHPVIGSLVGAECAIISNFILNNAWTFKSRSIAPNSRFLKFIQFNGTSLGAILIQSGTVFIGTQLFGIGTYRVFYIVGVGIGLIYNYIMYSRVIWKK